MTNKCSLEVFFNLLLRPMDIPQSRVVPAEVFDAIYNVASAWVIGKVIELWPRDQRYIDIIEPFLRVDIKDIADGYVKLPKAEDYRNFLDAGILVNKSKTAICNDTPSGLAMRKHEIDATKSICERVPLRIVDQTEYDFFTQDKFDMPTLKAPIACFFGEEKLKICPVGMGKVEIRYLVNEKLYRYGYISQPDDTFIYDPDTSVDTEFTNAAFDKLYSAALKLVSIYLRDGNVANFSVALNEIQFL